MDTDLIVGLGVMSAGIVTAVVVAFRGEPYEALWGVFLGQWGAVFVVRSLVSDGLPQLGSSIFLYLTMAGTAVLYWDMRKRVLRRGSAQTN